MRSDICLILEGTYPYVAGGVSTWVAQILQSMPDIKFSILFIGATPEQTRELKYDIPLNVTEIQEIFIHDFPKDTRTEASTKLTDEEWQIFKDTALQLMQGKTVNLLKVRQIALKPKNDEDFMQLFAYSKKSWDIIEEIYKENISASASFLDFFWTFRFINLPFLKLMRATPMQARCYHTACTGYAGLLGSLFNRLTGAPLLISEHGIYTRERRIEIFDADWICGTSDVPLALDLARERNLFKEWWSSFFLSLSRIGYNSSFRIFSLFSANRRDQIADGAPSELVKIIPNGIALSRFADIKTRVRSKDDLFVIGYVGRIASIKDVKTLIRSLESLKSMQVNFKALLMGPLDEDIEYAQECKELVTNLGIDSEVEFTGRVNIVDKLHELDVVVLSSISEGLPFAILEAGCAGIPFVATNVGACKELINGLTDEDKALGAGGFIVPVATPEEMAKALMRLANNPEMAQKMGQAAKERAKRFYEIGDVMQRYRQEYEYALEFSNESLEIY